MSPITARVIASGIPLGWSSSGPVEIVWHDGEPLATGRATFVELLDQALKMLATNPVPTKGGIDTLKYTTNGVREHFGITIHPASLAEITWTTAHADLHWGNITGPELCILGWESWRSAPAGFDAATLYCNSLLHPPTAQRIRELFRPVLDTRSGHIALLFAVCRYLWIVDEGGEYEALGTPLRRLGTEVINSL